MRMETNNTETPNPPPSEAPQLVQLAIVNLGGVIFHNKWFHSAGIGPAKDPQGNVLEGDQIQLKISLVSPGGMGEGFTFSGTTEEVLPLYKLLQQQVGTIPTSALRQGIPEEPPKEYAPLELVRPDEGEKDASEQDGPSEEA